MVDGLVREGWVEENGRAQTGSDEGKGNAGQERVSEIRDSEYGRAVGLQLRPLYHNHGAAEDLGGIKVRVRRR
jgi:hypothetical protein